MNLAAEPRVSLLVDHYDEDWRALWWVRADGLAAVAGVEEEARALAALGAKYPQYRAIPPEGPAVVVEIRRWRWWSASATAGTEAAARGDAAEAPGTEPG